MFCSNCGKQLETSSLSCTRCRAAVFLRAPLQRPLTHRVFGGVCAAFALHLGWRVGRVRFVTALLILFTCVGGLAYLIAWFVIPSEPYPIPSKSF
jgi:phage shock protein PspC (stress-responsive transcriptional regulator)